MTSFIINALTPEEETRQNMDDTSEAGVDHAFEMLKEWCFKEMGSMKQQVQDCDRSLRDCKAELTEIRGQMAQMNARLLQVVEDNKERLEKTGDTVRVELLKLLDSMRSMINAQLGKGAEDTPAGTQPEEQTVTVVDGLFDLDDEWRERLEPFLTRSRQTDLLTEVQLAFFNWFIKIKAKGGTPA